MIEVLKKEWKAQIALVLLFILAIWWFIGPQVSQQRFFGDFPSIYAVMALLGGIWGIGIAGKWGGVKSVMGKAIIMFSLGLLSQVFGQLAYAYLSFYKHIEVPYPSIGDVGYFGSIPLYIYATLLLAKASGARINLQSFTHKIRAVLIPLGMLTIAYFFFLQGYEFDWTNPIKIFLDFGYPMGQAVYISIALLTFLLSRNILGGIMRDKIFFILFALFIQFLSDYTFLYQSSRGTWSVGGVNDYMYLVAYFFMTLGLLQLKTVLEKLKNK
jgi:hypothetical protein